MKDSEFLRAATGQPLPGATGQSDDHKFRQQLLNRFAAIHQEICCEHAPGEGFVLADAILRLKVPGPVVECGCYRGGMTAKLSWVCDATDRELFVVDSFQGLPQPELYRGHYHFYASRPDVIEKFGESNHFKQGQYAASIDRVVANLSQHGKLSICRFVAGFFNDTLPRLQVNPALVWMDVDLIESARECLTWLWPRLQGSQFFTHEAFNETYIQGILDPKWWQDHLGENSPPIIGAATGLGVTACCLAWLEKNSQPDQSPSGSASLSELS